MKTATLPPKLPLLPRPNLVFRVAFAGNITLPAEASPLRAQALDTVLDVLAQQLAAIPIPPPEIAKAWRLTDYYDLAPPLLRLVTGLAEGSDDEAVAALHRLAIRQTGETPPIRPVRTELAAVLGCDVASYRESRSVSYRPTFDALLEECAYVLTLDGHYQLGEAGEGERRQMYRAQSAFLLRHADLLLAAADPQQVGKAGGTIETMRHALRFGLPVVFLHTGTGRVSYIAPGEDPVPLLETLIEANTASSTWQIQLAAWVKATIDGPETHDTSQSQGLSKEDGYVLQEYFTRAEVPYYYPTGPNGKALRRAVGMERYWNTIIRWFTPANLIESKPKETRWQSFRKWLNKRRTNYPLVSLVGYERYRRRAADLSGYYAGGYRGTFASNYTLAIIVACLVGFGLVVVDHRATNYGTEYPLTDFLIELGKVLCIFFVFFQTQRAQKQRWNDRAVDYRYLSERLKTVDTLLPLLGSVQPPSTVSLHFASRVVRQSAVEWLFKAIVRSIPPRDPAIAPVEVTIAELSKPLLVRQLPYQAEVGLAALARWIKGETVYHHKNEQTMENMNAFLERWAKWIGYGFLLLLAANCLGLLAAVEWPDVWEKAKVVLYGDTHSASLVLKPSEAEHLKREIVKHNWVQRYYLPVAPWLLFLTVLLPVIVVALSSIRLQSEARRLTERSHFLLKLLEKRKQRVTDLASKQATNPGACWSVQILKEGEGIAADHVQEVTEWSVVYAKDIPDS